jgi:hypothetical protein
MIGLRQPVLQRQIGVGVGGQQWVVVEPMDEELEEGVDYGAMLGYAGRVV